MRRYPIGPQMLSVRTDDLPAGAIALLGYRRTAVHGLTKSRYHRRCNDSWPGIKVLVLRRGERNSLPDLEVSTCVRVS